MKYRILLLSLLCGLFSLNSYGQDSVRLSLSTLWEHALSSYPSLKAYQAQVNQAKIDYQLVRHEYLPDAQLQAQNTIGSQNAVGGAFFPLPGIFNVAGTNTSSTSASASNLYGSVVVDWKFFQFGRQKKATKAAEIIVKQADHQLRAEQLGVRAEVSRSYLRLLFHQQMVSWAEINTQRLKALYQAAESRARAGLTPGADSLLIKASLRQTSAILHSWIGYQEESALTLSSWTQIPDEQLLTVQQNFPKAFASPTLEASAGNAATHPLLASRQESIRHTEKLKELTTSQMLPSLSLIGGAQLRGYASAPAGLYSDSFGTVYDPPVYNYLVGVSLQWNLGDLFDYRLEKSMYQEEIFQKQAEAEDVALQLKIGEETMRKRTTQSLKQIRNADEAYEAAADAYKQFEARYQSGLIPISELLQIQDILQRAEKTRLEAYYQYWVQQTNLAETNGDFSILRNAFN